MAESTCAGCGDELPAMKYQGNPRKWCSERCRVAYWRNQNLARSRRMAADFARRKTAERRAAEGTPIGYRGCIICGAGFVVNLLTPDRSRTVCSNACRNRRNVVTPVGQKARRASKDRRRARKRGAYVADVDRLAIFERDGWRCQLCRKRVRRNAKVPDDLAPTIDHVHPLAEGGTHEPKNCQLACFRCNSEKGQRAANDQLRLIG